jgi:phosphatidylserine/phosphatidylglycerophosphate/cardiolipin synthase-like enzyme
VRRIVLLVLAACVALAGCSAAGDSGSDADAAPPGTPAGTPAGTPPPGTLSLLVEPDQGVTPIYRVVAAARTSIDLVMYELADPTAVRLLEQAAARGVAVRVLLDANRERAANTAAFDELAAHGVHVAWAPSGYAATHEKAMVVDGAIAAVMSLNLTSRYYADTRDFAMLDTQPADVRAIEQVFDADFRHRKTTAAHGADLVWSPGSQAALLHLIENAHAELLVENEEMALRQVTAALAAAARRGVRVTVVMTAQPDWAADFDTLTAAGVRVSSYAPNAPLYIHAKSVVADPGTAHAAAFVGSENFSAASLNRNRELGILTADPGIVGRLAATITSDAAGGTPWQR